MGRRIGVNRRILGAIAFGFVGLTASSSAMAQSVPGFVVHRYEPSERGSEWFAGESLDLRGSLRPAIGVVGDYSARPFTIEAPDGSIAASPVRNTIFAHLGGSLVLVDRLRLAATLPIQVFTDGHLFTNGVQTLLPPGPGLGHRRSSAGANVRLFGTYGEEATGAIGVQVMVPTGARGQYTSDGEVRFRPRAMLAGDIGMFVYSAQLNFEYRGRSERIAGAQLGSELGMVATAGVRVADKKLVLGPEVWGRTVLDPAFHKDSTPFEALLGAHYTIADAFRVGAGAGVGLGQSLGTPQFRALLSFEWMPGVTTDSDGDGIEDKEDACPTQPGVKTSDPKTNGCPPAAPPADRDGDGVPDSEDACVDVAGQRTTDPKTNGCPPDADKDGIPDQQDACPHMFGVATSDPKTNGCPAVTDADGDGVPDKEDACPQVPGLKTTDPKIGVRDPRLGPPVDRGRGQLRVADRHRLLGDRSGHGLHRVSRADRGPAGRQLGDARRRPPARTCSPARSAARSVWRCSARLPTPLSPRASATPTRTSSTCPRQCWPPRSTESSSPPPWRRW